MIDELVTTPAPRPRGARIALAGMAVAIAAAAGVWLVARYGAGVALRTPAFNTAGRPSTLTIGFVVVVAAVASLAGWGTVTLIGWLARRPRRTWITTGIAATVVSLSAPLSGHGITATERLALVCMHLAVAAAVVPVLAVTVAPKQPVADNTPAGRGPDRRPRSAVSVPR